MSTTLPFLSSLTICPFAKPAYNVLLINMIVSGPNILPFAKYSAFVSLWFGAKLPSNLGAGAILHKKLCDVIYNHKLFSNFK